MLSLIFFFACSKIWSACPPIASHELVYARWVSSAEGLLFSRPAWADLYASLFAYVVQLSACSCRIMFARRDFFPEEVDPYVISVELCIRLPGLFDLVKLVENLVFRVQQVVAQQVHVGHVLVLVLHGVAKRTTPKNRKRNLSCLFVEAGQITRKQVVQLMLLFVLAQVLDVQQEGQVDARVVVVIQHQEDSPHPVEVSDVLVSVAHFDDRPVVLSLKVEVVMLK